MGEGIHLDDCAVNVVVKFFAPRADILNRLPNFVEIFADGVAVNNFNAVVRHEVISRRVTCRDKGLGIRE